MVANAETRTLLSVDRFFRVTGINPLHGNQVVLPDGAGGCGVIIFQNAYQAGGRVGREEIAQAIDDAERRIAQWIGFDLAPRWVHNAEIAMPRMGRPEGVHMGRDLRGAYSTVKAPSGYVQEGGAEAWESQEADVSVDFEDRDDDGYNERASITFSTFTTNADEVMLTYPASAVDEPTAWEIRPLLSVKFNDDDTTTVTFRREQLVRPELLTSLNQDIEVGVDGTDDASFLDVVDVYRHFSDPGAQVTFQWMHDCPTCQSSTSACVACTFIEQSGCMRVQNKRQGLVSLAPGAWDSETSQFVAQPYSLQCQCRRAPDKAVLNYRAGWDWDGSMTKMAPIWERSVAYLALSLLSGDLCSCLDKLHAQWSDDLLLQESGTDGSRSFQVARSKFIQENPLGTTRAALYAWSNLIKVRLGESIPAH